MQQQPTLSPTHSMNALEGGKSRGQTGYGQAARQPEIDMAERRSGRQELWQADSQALIPVARYNS